MTTPVIVPAPEAVAAADAQLRACENRYGLVTDALARVRVTLRQAQRDVQALEAAKHATGLSVDEARERAALARKAAGLALSAGGYVEAGS